MRFIKSLSILFIFGLLGMSVTSGSAASFISKVGFLDFLRLRHLSV
jgi:hypothetical protein